MIKVFIRGLVFGSGFSIALIGVSLIVAELRFPSKGSATVSEYDGIGSWHELSVNEKINRCSAVALVRFKDGEDGLKTAYVKEIYKKDDSTVLNVNVGQRMEKLDYYAKGVGRNRNGLLVYFSGEPGKQRETDYMYEDRLIASGDMPLKVFLKKFEQTKSGELEISHASYSEPDDERFEETETLFKLPIDEKIKRSTAIMVTKYIKDDAGKLKNKVIEILKKGEGIDLYYEVGDEYEAYGEPEGLDINKQIGYVVFMRGNPADIDYSLSYNNNDEMIGFGNESLSDLRQKCEAEEVNQVKSHESINAL